MRRKRSAAVRRTQIALVGCGGMGRRHLTGLAALAQSCFAAGLHVLCEKPLALTMRGCNAIIAAAHAAGRVLSVAENYRRDPINRLARALIADGALGTPQLMLEISIGGGNRMLITPWRHDKLT